MVYVSKSLVTITRSSSPDGLCWDLESEVSQGLRGRAFLTPISLSSRSVATCASDAREHTVGPGGSSEAEASKAQEEDVYLENGVEALETVTGKPPLAFSSALSWITYRELEGRKWLC